MKTREKLEGVSILDLMLSSESSFFRVEALESYNAEEEEEIRSEYDSGNPAVPEYSTDCPWFAKIKEMKDAGNPVCRVRALSRNISPYVRFEMEWGYNPVSLIGEDYRIIIKEQHPELSDSWDEEYYIIDNKRLVYIKYDETGKTLGLEEEKDTEEIKKRLDQQKRLLQKAVPYNKFLAHLRKNVPLIVPDIDINSK